MYKLEEKQKKEGYKVLDNQDIEKYTPSVFMMPQSFYFVSKEDATEIQTHVKDFITSIADGAQELFIPIFTSSCSHWTLLHFNFGHAELMMSTCNIPIKERKEKLHAEYPIIEPIEETPFVEPICVQQKKSNYLLFVAYFMKLIMKRRDIPQERSNVTKKMKMKRIKMAVKMVTDLVML
ncbi:hypothetical protein MKX01_014804 [Papaver californicum]|nr:hypothetical protein MKX01_014804 [Papaver californicum]